MSLLVSVALACSTVVVGGRDQPLIAYSYDFEPFDGGMLLANAAGTQRRSIMENEVASWTADHASLTFTQFGPGMPMAGMNAQGLVVSLMWNDEVAYPQAITAPVVNELEFIQFLLDGAGSVDEALDLAFEVTITGLVPVHYLVADGTGDTAVLMPTRDGFAIWRGEALPVQALTNSSYDTLLANLPATAGVGQSGTEIQSEELSLSSPRRFTVAAQASRQGDLTTMAQAFDLLDDLANRQSRWQFVFDPAGQRLAVRLPGAGAHQVIELDAVDLTCLSAPTFIDLRTRPDGSLESAFAPLGLAPLEGMLTEMLTGFGSRTGLSPAMAGELAGYLLQSSTCRP
jgi:hypothetical protein